MDIAHIRDIVYNKLLMRHNSVCRFLATKRKNINENWREEQRQADSLALTSSICSKLECILKTKYTVSSVSDYFHMTVSLKFNYTNINKVYCL